MKKRIVVRATCLILALCIMLISASASTETSIQPRHISVNLFSANLDLTSSGYADCYACVSVRGNDTVTLIMTLKRSVDGNTWTIEETWSTSGTGTVSLDDRLYIVSGYYYKVTATATVYNEDGYYIETANASSSIEPYGVN